MGRVLLHGWQGVPSGVVVLGVALFSIAALYGVTRIEAIVHRKLSEAS